jgi:hypothetical protein
LWIAYSAWAGAWPLLVNHILFAGINGWGWYKWTKEDRIAAQAWAEMEAAEEEYRRKRDEQIDQDRKARLFVRD